MLICEECKRKFDDDEIATWQEDRGEFWGAKAYETMWGCPYCFSTAVVDFDEWLKKKDDEEAEESENDDG